MYLSKNYFIFKIVILSFFLLGAFYYYSSSPIETIKRNNNLFPQNTSLPLNNEKLPSFLIEEYQTNQGNQSLLLRFYISSDQKSKSNGHSKKRMSYFDAIELMKGSSEKSEEFRELLTSKLKDIYSKFGPFLFETPPIRWDFFQTSTQNFNPKIAFFEATIIQYPSLYGVKPSPQSFGEPFREQDCLSTMIVSFKNLRGDAVLVSPCPTSLLTDHIKSTSQEVLDYSHIGTFIKYAPSISIHNLWKEVGLKVVEQIYERKDRNPEKWTWLSTHGLGVYWLHVRIDEIPKYYNHNEYKNPYTFYKI